MIDKDVLLRVIRKSADVAAQFQGIDVPYSVSLIDDPSFEQDGLFGTGNNEIVINLATLKPYPLSSIPLKSENPTDEEIKENENLRYALKATFIVFHEMRHLYQKCAVTAYAINRMMAGREIHLLESDKKCSLWESEMKAYTLGEGNDTDLEADAEAFAEYLIHRYPVKIKMTQTSKRMGALKRKYDKVAIPVIENGAEKICSISGMKHQAIV